VTLDDSDEISDDQETSDKEQNGSYGGVDIATDGIRKLCPHGGGRGVCPHKKMVMDE
jgi:hypothetical protein